MSSSIQSDDFARRHLPPAEQLPELSFSGESLSFPAQLNCAVELVDRQVAAGLGDKTAVIGERERWTYRELLHKSNQVATALRDELGLVPGNRVLLRAPNTPMLAACWLGVLKAGGIAVATMPLLRAVDLAPVIARARVELALCDARLLEELTAVADWPGRVLAFDGEGGGAAERLEALFTGAGTVFDNAPTAAEDVALIAFTSGTTGQPKGAVHFHRDVMAMDVCVGRHLVGARESDVFIGSPPLAFTFGLGMQLVFPLSAGATAVLLEDGRPQRLAEAISRHGATVCATAPTAYRAMLKQLDDYDLGSLRLSVSAGEHLDAATAERWQRWVGAQMINGLGSTEMIHIFLATDPERDAAGALGRAVHGYEVALLDDENRVLEGAVTGRLAVKGPTGCKYLADERQRNYVADGWNLTGDICRRDEDGAFWFVARADDMIISAGYNIAAPEVEAALLAHDDVAECAVIGVPDEDRGQRVKAFVVLRAGVTPESVSVDALQDFVKQTVAPYKYPREIEFCAALPKTPTGKIQRRRLQPD